MFEKEKAVLSFLGVLVSLVILIFIIVWGMDFTNVKLKFMGRSLMEQMEAEKYGEIYKQFTGTYALTLNQFIEEQKSINEILGSLKEYRLIKVYRNRAGGDVSLIYETAFINYPDKKINYKWQLGKIEKGWCVLNLQVETEDVFLRQKLNSKNKEAEKRLRLEMEEAKKLAWQRLEEYKNGQYSVLYANFTEAMRKRGEEKQFVQYLETAKKLYGDLEVIELVEEELSNDRKEIKLKFEAFSHKINNKINISVWIRLEDNLNLSGFTFSSGSW